MTRLSSSQCGHTTMYQFPKLGLKVPTQLDFKITEEENTRKCALQIMKSGLNLFKLQQNYIYQVSVGFYLKKERNIDINALPLWSVIGNIKEQQYLNNVNEM